MRSKSVTYLSKLGPEKQSIFPGVIKYWWNVRSTRCSDVDNKIKTSIVRSSESRRILTCEWKYAQILTGGWMHAWRSLLVVQLVSEHDV